MFLFEQFGCQPLSSLFCFNYIWRKAPAANRPKQQTGGWSGACEQACIPTTRMAGSRFRVPGCVDFPFKVHWTPEEHSEIAGLSAGYWPSDGDYPPPMFAEANIGCEDYAPKCGGPSLSSWQAYWPLRRHPYHRDRTSGLSASIRA